MKTNYYILVIVLFITPCIYAQIMNTRVEAILDIQESNHLIHITGIAQNKTEITENISYSLSVIKTNTTNNNQSKNDQKGHQVLASFEKSILSKTSINATTEDRIIVLLLLYDSSENLIGHTRFVYNDNKEDDTVKEELTTQWDAVTQKKTEAAPAYSKITFKGIVVDETKTKAGRDFYQLYYSNYLANSLNSEQIITIAETITMGNNTKISIKIEHQTLFEFFVKTQYDYLKSMSDTALRMTIRYLENLKINNQRTQTF